MTKYIIITPARDEADHLERTIASVVGQTIRPTQWILVNDGSRDATGEIMDRYAQEHSWITVCHRQDRGFRKAGGGVVDAFYDGYSQITCTDWDFIVKLDADLGFSPEYFEQCFAEFTGDARLGVGGGMIYHDLEGKLTLEQTPRFHVRGATKIYRRACWEAIGGLERAPGWDTIDELKANMLGWTTRSFPHLPLLHYRFTGSADGAWRNSIKDGRANYITGYHPLFMAIKCASRSVKPPYVLGSLGLMVGYLGGYWKHTPQIQDDDLIQYVRQQQIRRLMRAESIWR